MMKALPANIFLFMSEQFWLFSGNSYFLPQNIFNPPVEPQAHVC